MKIRISFIGLFFMLLSGDICLGQQLDNTNKPAAYPFSPIARPFIKTLDADFQIAAEFRAIIQDSLGIMYFGNNNFGIQQFDGVNWTLISPPNRSAAYGLAIDENGTIYAGVRGDFGYLAPDSLQQLQFRSLLPHAPDSLQNFDHVYVEIIKDAVFFCTNPYVFRWKDGVMTIWEDAGFAGCGVAGDTFYINDQNNGLLALVDDTFQMVSPLLKNSQLTAVLELQEAELFVTTQAVFEKKKGNKVRLLNRFSDIRSNISIYDAVLLKDQNIAFATNNGIYIYTPDGHLVHHLTQSDGLSSNEINNLLVDEGGNLWAATGLYLNFIEYNSPLRLLFDAQEYSTGINTAFEFEEKLFLGTQTGLFIWDGQKWINRLPEIIIWDFARIGNLLLIGAREGLFVYGNGDFTQLNNKSVRVITASERYEKLAYIYYLGSGIEVLKQKTDGSFTSYPLLEFSEPIYTLTEDEQGHLWRGTGNWGIYNDRLRDNDGRPELVETIHYSQEDGLPGASYNYTTKIAGEVGFITEEGLFQFNKEQQKIVRDRRFLEAFPVKPGIGRRAWPSIEDNWGHVWLDFGGKRIFEMIPDNEGNYQLSRGPYGRISVFGDVVDIYRFNEKSALFLTGSQAFLFNRSLQEAPRYPFNTLVRSITINEDSLLWGGYGPVESTLENDIHFTNQSLRFNWSATTYFPAQKTQYRHRLVGLNGQWSTWTSETYRDFTNLSEGNYTFEVQARNIYDVTGQTASMNFTVLPPWYRSWWAYGLYVIFGLLGLVFTVHRTVKWRIRQQMMEMKAEQAEELKKLDVVKTQFFSNVSHELRTPLTLTIGPLEDLKTKNLQEPEMSKVSMALRNSKRLLTLVSEILDISRLEASNNKLLVSKYDLATFVKATSQNFSSLANRKNITYTIQTPDSLNAWFNQDQMDKVITNLLSNAFKFTPDGKEISISLISQNNEAIITVRDTGMGIPQKDLPFIFDRFYQSSNSGSRMQHGTGIGLALVKYLVDLHGGTIKAESEFGVGTVFTVELPLDADTLPHAEIVQTSDQVPSLAPHSIVIDGEEVTDLENSSALDKEDHTTVLVVEDNLELRQFVVGHLSESYRIIEAENGKKGLEKTSEFLPDLVICDVMMPEMDGFEYVEKMRNDDAINFIPVIMLTGKDTKEDKLKGLEHGANDYIVKPFDMDELKARIKSTIKSQKLLKARFETETSIFSIDKKKLKSVDQKFIEQVKETILANLADPALSVEKLASIVHVGRTTLHRKLTTILGETPVQLIRKIRLEQAKVMIENKSGSISEIAYSVGFESISWFSKCFKEEYKVKPSDLLS